MKSKNDTIIHLFTEQALTSPGAPAVLVGQEQFTYQDLNEKSNQLAHYLIDHGVTPGTMVGICFERSFEMLISILAILKARCAYVPIDPEYPTGRIQYILKDTAMPMVLTMPGIYDRLVDNGNSGIHYQNIALEKKQTTGWQSFPTHALPEFPQPADLAYVIYTSGSTGNPKGVMNEHGGLYNRLLWAQDYFKLTASDTVLQKTTYCFDVSVWELLWPILVGARIAFAAPGGHKDSEYLKRAIVEYDITTIHFVPSMLEIFLLDSVEHLNNRLKRVLCSGEALTTHQVSLFREKLPHVLLFNLYGPTEAAIDVTCWKVPDDFETVTIGTPIANTRLYIVDDHLNPLPVGETGELCIGGIQVARGYLNLPALTADRFIPNPFDEGRIYRTGDLARQLSSGEIEYLGRIDNQVKIRGFRIELGEIEQALVAIEGIRQCCVAVWEDEYIGKQLVAYWTGDDKATNAQLILNALRQKLPDYMIPDKYMHLNELPLSANGKLNRKALPIPDRQRKSTSDSLTVSQDQTEKDIKSSWQSILGLASIRSTDNFFELGGNSLLAMKFVSHFKRAKGYRLPIVDLYQYPTPQKLADYIQNGRTSPINTSKTSQKGGVDRAVAIIGMAGRFPGAKNIEELWDVLLAGKETITFFDDHELDPGIPSELRKRPEYVKARGIIDGAEWFDAAVFGITPVMARLMDPQQRIFLEICRDVLEQTGYLVKKDQYTIGVYAGSGNATYFSNNLRHHPEEISKIGEFQTMLLNERDYIPTRVAYQLNLNGPAVAINTACSTSLVAVAQAVESIRSKQCDMAIAGGVSITVPINSGQLFEEGAMFSKDGHTRTFDVNATGTVFSDGGGVVLLKELEAAQADGDTIYAVIKGVGISNDGGGKGSFMAPSSEGQAQAIRMAIDDADIDPNDIGYIEAHGTATPIGDPIELLGLKMAFGETTKNQYCRIGSIKSNLGHLTHASGVAGLIKTALSLHHGVIPPTINFERAHPNIDFENSPFEVNETLTQIDTSKKFIAGVSSFGVGGTNAHVILSAIPFTLTQTTASPTVDHPIVVTWSAQTIQSGEAYAKKLADYLERNPLIKPEEVTYTLQQTQERLSHRFSVASVDRTQLINRLRTGQFQQHELKEQSDQLVFLFPGQGAQYIGMGSDLYQREPVYQEAIDHCADLLKNEMGEDIRPILFPATERSSNDASALLRDTYYTQPALFVTSYALAQLWMSWGIWPTALIGHSVGEFVAAHLAGVFSLEDALKLVAIRGKLSKSVPIGSMLSVRASAEKIQTILPRGLSIAANNAPQLCVVSGPEHQIAEFINFLNEQDIPNKFLHTSHAFHSEMMRPIQHSFIKAISDIQLSPPKLPIVSTVKGSWLSDDQATDPGYWADHIVSTVRFSDAILFAEKTFRAPIYLEVGPGQVTSTLTKQHGTSLSGRAFSSITQTANNERQSIREAVGQLATHGFEPRWYQLYGYYPKVLKTIPTYAYDKQVFWLSPGNHHEGPSITANKISNTAMKKDHLITRIKSILEDASGISLSEASLTSNFIALGFDSLLLTQVAQHLKKAFRTPVTFRMLNENCQNLELLASYLATNLPQEEQDNIKSPQAQPMENNAIPQTNPIQNEQLDAISLISQQISLISQQIALLQGQSQLPAITGPVAKKESLDETFLPKSAATTATAHKPKFGTSNNTQKGAIQLNERQHIVLNNFIDRYIQKTIQSKSYTQEHRDHLADPRVVSGFRPLVKEVTYPLVIDKSNGCYLWDLDGNKYIDTVSGYGSNLLGYQHKVLKKALLKQIDAGYEIGSQHEKAGKLSKIICDFTGFDRVTFCNSGSEAVTGAIRIARTVTGRDKVVVFADSIHGNSDEMQIRGTGKHQPLPAFAGITSEAISNVIVLEYGSADALAYVEEYADNIAAVLVEPIQSRKPAGIPLAFLKDLRQLTNRLSIVLIFDEVVSGFRYHLQGAQGLTKVTADIAVYGKALGGGLPIGVIAGHKSFMDSMDGGTWQYGDRSTPEIGVTYFSSSFFRHPLALASSYAFLSYLKEEGTGLLEILDENTRILVEKLNSICLAYQLPIVVERFSSLWQIKFKEDSIINDLLFLLMRSKGVHIWSGIACFLTTAHTTDDLNEIIRAFEESVHELAKSGFIAVKGYHGEASFPPLPHARLGRDIDGTAAWFVRDTKNPEKYLKVIPT